METFAQFSSGRICPHLLLITISVCQPANHRPKRSAQIVRLQQCITNKCTSLLVARGVLQTTTTTINHHTTTSVLTGLSAVLLARDLVAFVAVRWEKQIHNFRMDGPGNFRCHVAHFGDVRAEPVPPHDQQLSGH